MTVSLPSTPAASVFQNPFRKHREKELGISRIEFCRRTGLSYFTATSAEIGRSQTASVPVMMALASLGIDIGTLPAEYEKWRAGR